MARARKGKSRAAPSSLRTRMDRRAEIKQWAHHVADLNSGRIRSTVLREPPTSKSRLERLARLGSAFDRILGSPLYRLTPRAPYQASPEAWLSGFGIDYLNLRIPDIQWVPEGAPSTPGDMKGLFFYFSQLPPELSLLTISLNGHAMSGTVGHVAVGYVPFGEEFAPPTGQVRIPIKPVAPEQQTLDLLFDPRGMEPPSFVMTLEANIGWLEFTSVTLRTAPLFVLPDDALLYQGPF